MNTCGEPIDVAKSIIPSCCDLSGRNRRPKSDFKTWVDRDRFDHFRKHRNRNLAATRRNTRIFGSPSKPRLVICGSDDPNTRAVTVASNRRADLWFVVHFRRATKRLDNDACFKFKLMLGKNFCPITPPTTSTSSGTCWCAPLR